MFDNRIIILKRWRVGLRFERELLNTLLIWVKFVNLELELQDKEAISDIASMLGNPIKMGKITVDESRAAYAKILTEMEANREYPDEMEAMLYSGEVLKIKV